MAASYRAEIHPGHPPAPTTSAAGRSAAPWSSSSPANSPPKVKKWRSSPSSTARRTLAAGEAEAGEADEGDDHPLADGHRDYLQRLWGFDFGITADVLRAPAPESSRAASSPA